MTDAVDVHAAVRADNEIREIVQTMVWAGCNMPIDALYGLAVVAFLSGRISARRETIAVVDSTLAIAKAATP